MAERGLIYGRASRDPKHRGTSVDDQIRECQAWADLNGVTVLSDHIIRDDNRSASASAKRERQGFIEVLTLIAAGSVDVLIVWEASRAARDLEAFLPLRAACLGAGVDLVSKGRRYDLSHSNDSFNASLDALIAERDASDIRDRNVRTVRRNAELKRPHGRLPYGYRRVYDATTGSLLDQSPYVLDDGTGSPVEDDQGALMPVLPDSDEPKVLSPEAQVLVAAATQILDGVSLRKVTMDLNQRGVPSPRRPSTKTLEENPRGVVEAWHPASLRQRLVNPTIAGRRIHQGQDIGEATWAPIIEYGTWLKVNAVLSNPSRRSTPVPRGPAPRHLLSHIARCGECGARMKARTNMSRMPRAYTCDHEGCRKVTITAPKVDKMVETLVLRLFETDGFRRFLTEAFRQRPQAKDSGPDLHALITAKESERDDLEELRGAGDISLRAYAAEDLRIEQELDQLRSQEVAPVTSPALRRMLSAGSVAAGWGEADLMDRRDVIRLLLDVQIHKATKRGRAFDVWRVDVLPGDFLLDSWDRQAGADVEEGEPAQDGPDAGKA
ncbi:recombinase family protein [Brachybacterium tyrofermentans]|uniref:recombinase family protein n=1 Tax=Brachybacterium tyrofermentans TaxID=47848 RepID=UPI0018686CED|nr:recombinase family protein [Brachybacterium tyrofermentans]